MAEDGVIEREESMELNGIGIESWGENGDKVGVFFSPGASFEDALAIEGDLVISDGGEEKQRYSGYEVSSLSYTANGDVYAVFRAESGAYSEMREQVAGIAAQMAALAGDAE